MHRSAAQGFAKASDSYVAGRPGYSADLDRWLTDNLLLGSGIHVLDLGAGTGKFSELLVRTAASVTAVEPVDAMRSAFAEALPDVPVLSGTAEQLPLDSDSLDCVVCAQAFHWFANQDAMSEIARVLRPGGRFGLIWNVRDERVPWVSKLTDIMRPFEAGTPRFSDGRWRQVFPCRGFGPLRETWFEHGHVGPPEDVIVRRILSVSFIAALPEHTQERVASDIRDLIRSTREISGLAEVTFPYRTLAVYCVRE